MNHHNKAKARIHWSQLHSHRSLMNRTKNLVESKPSVFGEPGLVLSLFYAPYPCRFGPWDPGHLWKYFISLLELCLWHPPSGVKHLLKKLPLRALLICSQIFPPPGHVTSSEKSLWTLMSHLLLQWFQLWCLCILSSSGALWKWHSMSFLHL